MSKTAIVYWSGTGNTEALANKIYESAKSFGKDVQIFTAGEFSEDKVDEFDTVIYGFCTYILLSKALSGKSFLQKILFSYYH